MINSTHSPIRPGIAFREGKFYKFSKDGIIVASQWPDMRAWRKTPKGSQWIQIRPCLRLSMFIDGRKDKWAFDLSQRERRIRSQIDGEPIWFRMERAPGTVHPMYDDEFFEVYGMEQDEETPAHIDETPDRSWLPKIQKRQHEVQAEYLMSIPGEVLEAIAKYQCRQWHLLNLVARCPGALDLVRSNPALAFCVASLWVFRKPAPCRPLRSARSLLKKPQTDIAAWLGFSETRSAVRVLQKFEAWDCTISNLLTLRRLIPSHIHRLRHLPYIDGAVLRLLSWESDQCRFSDRFLQEMASSPSDLPESYLAYVRDVLWMRKSLGEIKALVVRSRDHLIKLHDHLVDRMGRSDLRVFDKPPFPDPPLAPSSQFLEVYPIRDEGDLKGEGIMQENCVGNYGSRVRTGKLFVYRLLSPERATLSVALSRSGRWQLSEIEGQGRDEVGTETLEAVQFWIDEAWRSSLVGCVSEEEPF